jgi:hypothetical protein
MNVQGWEDLQSAFKVIVIKWEVSLGLSVLALLGTYDLERSNTPPHPSSKVQHAETRQSGSAFYYRPKKSQEVHKRRTEKDSPFKQKTRCHTELYAELERNKRGEAEENSEEEEGEEEDMTTGSDMQSENEE